MAFVGLLLTILLTSLRYGTGVADCPDNWIDCLNGVCVFSLWLCDGHNDCGNNQDEKNCEARPVVCTDKEFQCADDGECIPDSRRCDGHNDCIDSSDEINCENSTNCHGFRCRNNFCIPAKWKCDGRNDCPDNSDEDSCPKPPVVAKLCTDSEFTCGSGSCLDKKKVCDGKKDCPDGSDEGDHCDDKCSDATCSQKCRVSPHGPECYCEEGYRLDPRDNKTCADIDECAIDGLCSQRCANLLGSHKCSCLDGYDLENGTCVASGPEPVLVFSTLHEIRAMYLRSKKYFPVHKAISRAVVDVDVDPVDSRVYWVEISNRSAVYSTNLDGSRLETKLQTGLMVPEGIAVDYLGRNLYFTDSELKQILACKMDGSMCHVLHDKDIGSPRAITLDVLEGLLYWSDWGNATAGIYRSGMNGSRRVSVVAKDIRWPNGIAVDHTTNRLYWTDALLGTIEYITLDGKTRKVLIKDETFHPYSLAVFESQLYWSDWKSFSLDTCDKFSGHRFGVLVREKRHIMGVHVYHPVLARKTNNPCWGHPCSHMCLIAPLNGYTCACPPGFILGVNGRTCKDLICDEFQCSTSGECLSWEQVCDGVPDCTDLSDEGPLCTMPCVRCTQECRRSPHGPHCACRDGFRLAPDNVTCDDVDECADSPCTHFCENTKGGFKCSCADGYLLEQHTRCAKADGKSAVLVYLQHDQIRGVDLGSRTQRVYLDRAGADMRGVDFDEENGTFFWTAREEGTINSLNLDNERQDVIVRTPVKPRYLRWDWVARNLFYTDDEWSINVCTGDGKFCNTLIPNAASDGINGFDISPAERFVFWCSWGRMDENESGVIRRSQLDGWSPSSWNVVLVKDGLVWPSDVTVDHATHLLYWVDTKSNVMECVDFEGYNRRLVVASGMFHPFSMAVFEDYVYWSDWGSDSLIRCDKRTGKVCDPLDDTNVKSKILLVVHRANQPEKIKNKQLSRPTRSTSVASPSDRSGSMSIRSPRPLPAPGQSRPPSPWRRRPRGSSRRSPRRANSRNARRSVRQRDVLKN